MSDPFMIIVPCVGLSSPAIRRKRVVFPEASGPTIPISFPLGKETFKSENKGGFLESNYFVK